VPEVGTLEGQLRWEEIVSMVRQAGTTQVVQRVAVVVTVGQGLEDFFAMVGELKVLVGCVWVWKGGITLREKL
jgi:hypothetical protein